MTDHGSGWHTRGQGGTRGSQEAPGRLRGGQGYPRRRKEWWNSKIMTPNHELSYPKWVLTPKGWYLLISEAFGAIWMGCNRDIYWKKLKILVFETFLVPQIHRPNGAKILRFGNFPETLTYPRSLENCQKSKSLSPSKTSNSWVLERCWILWSTIKTIKRFVQ